VRNPYSAFADTSKRPFPLSLYRYSMTWSVMQLYATTFAARYPDRLHILRFEDLIANPRSAMERLAAKIGIAFSETMLYPSWGGAALKQVYPWGTIRTATPEANLATLKELSAEQRAEIRALTLPMLKEFGYLDL
jgi:hypothetical protein